MASGFRDLLAFLLGWHSSAAEVIPDVPGVEWTARKSCPHWWGKAARAHWTMPENRPHFEAREED